MTQIVFLDLEESTVAEAKIKSCNLLKICRKAINFIKIKGRDKGLDKSNSFTFLFLYLIFYLKVHSKVSGN